VPDPDSFYTKTRGAGKIIVVDLGFLGDSVHTLPALREIKRNYPKAELHVLSAPVGAELLKLAPSVTRAWSFPLGPKSPPWWKHWGLLNELRRERYDVVFNFSGADRTILVSGIVGAKWKVAYPGGRTHFWNHWVIPQWLPKIRDSLPIYQKRLRMLELCGLPPGPVEFELRIPAEAEEWASRTIPSGTLHISINASSPYKEWPLANWVELAQKLLAPDANLTLVATAGGSERETERLRELEARVADARLLCFSGLPLSRLAALLKRCRLHLGGDSGVLHLAFALGLQTVSIFREYEDMAEWLPAGASHRNVVAPCQCQRGLTEQCKAQGNSRCLSEISVPQVLDLVESLNASKFK